MIKFVTYLIRQKLLVNLMVMLLLFSGLYIAFHTNREAYPEVNFDMVSIKTVYPGGSPEECEQLISIPIEKKLREVGGIDKVRAYNIENVSVVVVFIDDKVLDRKAVVQDIKDAVELVEDLPSTVEMPVVEEIKFDKTPAIEMAIYGKSPNVSYRELREAAYEIEDLLYDINGVADVEKFGFYDKEYLVEVNPSALEKFRIGMNSIIDTLAARNLDFPGGSLKVGDKEFVLRTKGQYRSAEEIENTVVMSNDLFYITRIKDLGSVSDTFKEPEVYERFNGRKAIVFTVWKKRNADEIRLVDRIKSEFAGYKPLHSENVAVKFFNDTSRFTRHRLELVETNAIVGFALLAAILLLLLGIRMSAIVTISIPIAFMAAFFGMKMGGITLNVISLFGMIMVLGMIVDFAIVVSENSHRYLEMGCEKLEAIEKGVSEVFWPVTVTLLCISAAFAPLLFLSGLMGKFIKGIPIVLMMCLGASWLIAMFIIPTYLNIFTKTATVDRCNDDLRTEDPNFERGTFGKVQRAYKRFLGLALRHRYITLGALLLLLTGSLALSGTLGFVFAPSGGEEGITIKTRMPQETNLEANLREIRVIERIIIGLPKGELDALHSRVGIEGAATIDPKPGEGTHKSTILLYLFPDKDRKRNAGLIAAQLRSEILAARKRGEISPKMQFEIEVDAHGPPIGKPVNVEIRGKDFDVLKKISKEYMDYLHTIKGVTDISMDLEEGKQEYRYRINEVMASRTGVSMRNVAMALNASFEGAVASSVREGEENIDIRVRFPEWARKQRKSLHEVMIANPTGGLIPLDVVTSVTHQPGYTQINRLNYKRIVQVQAQVDTGIITSVEANRLLMKRFRDIEQRYPGYSISYGGEQEDTEERMGELGMLFLLALLVIYIILAVFFNSLIIPVVVMSAIPFAVVGVIFALAAHGQPLSFMSTLGIFSLAGVIVSNTLVLVQFINNKRDEGLPLREALMEAGVIRLRPVLLTTGTTVLALFPTIYGIGGKDHFVVPLSLSFGYGLIFATFITLVLIPSFYYIAEELKGKTAKLLGWFGIEIDGRIYKGGGE